MCSAELSMGFISGTTHIKTIFSLHSSDDSVREIIQILHIFKKINVFNISRGVKSGKRWGQRMTNSVSIQRLGNFQKGTKMMVRHPTGKMFFIISRKLTPVPIGSPRYIQKYPEDFHFLIHDKFAY
jgi:hypothetical protein